MQDRITLTTHVPKETQLTALRNGSAMALAGIGWIIGFATFAPPNFLATFGLPIILIGLGLITAGYVPYRKLTLLATHPDKLIIDAEGITFEQKGRAQCWIPLSSLSKVWHLDTPPRLACKIDNEPDTPIKVLNPHFPLKKLRAQALNSDQADLIFHHFSSRACRELQEIIDPPE